MQIPLQPQLYPLTMDGLRSFLKEQEGRYSNLTNIIARANARIEALRKEAAPSHRMTEGLSAQEERTFRNVAERQIVHRIGEIRREVDVELVPLVKALQSAAATAKEMAERHWCKYAVLRKAKNGNGGVQGTVEAMSVRASYATVLAEAGAVELARYAQQAIDTADAILADCVLRENGARKKDEQPFSNAALLEKLPNAEHDQAQALLNQVIETAERAGLAYSEFERGRYNSTARIALGLKKLQRANEQAHVDGAPATV